MTRRASCGCGRFVAICEGEPVRVSVCHCLDRQRRSGSAFAAQARWPVGAVAFTGATHRRVRTADSGATGTFHFCPECGAPGYHLLSADPGIVAVPLGAIADPTFPGPACSIYGERKHAWVAITGPDDHD